MRFERIHTVVVYLLVSTGFLVLFLSGELPSVYWLVSLPAVLGSIVVGGRPRYRSVTVWNIILLSAFFILTLFGSSSGDWLLSAVYFASLMVIAKLYQRSTSADYFQLYSLSFLQLVAGAVINPTLSFAVCFVLYVVFLTWALVLLHLRREMERLAAAEAAVEAAAERDTGDTTDTSSGDEATVIASAESWRVQRLVGPGFLAGTSLLAIVIFVCSTAVFLFFPRLGLGFFGQHKRSGERVSGFGNSIELGHFGTMKQDQTIIMRVEIDGKETRTALPLRLKGMSFDRYDGKSWRKSERMMWRLVESGQGGFMRVAPDGEIPAEAPRYTQRIYLERLDIDRRAVFGESKIVAVRDLLNSKHIPNHRDHTRFYQDNDRDLVYTTGDAAPALRYEVISTRVERQPERLREAGSNYPALSKRYLQLPELAPEIRALAQRITAEAENPFDKVGAIERYLMSNYRYSLEGGHDEEDPLKDFLFGRRSGHCEYFSTAMVVLSRAVGIPARPVGGFYGGEYNEVGNYIAIRQADAHSWVEVYFPGAGWTVFDPTPATGSLVAAEQGFWAKLNRTIDSMQLLWYKWVIRWDLQRQLAFFRAIGRKLERLTRFVPQGDLGLGSQEWGRWIRDHAKQLLIGMAILCGLVLLWFFRFRLRWPLPKRSRHGSRKAGRREKRIARSVYDRLLRAARRRGIAVTEATSARGLIRALREQSPYAAEQAIPIVQLYEETVFGELPLDPQRLSACVEHLSALKKRRGRSPSWRGSL